MIDRNEQTFMIGLDGGLRKIPAHMVNELQKQGWRMVTNPKRNYYYEYDTTNPHYKPPDQLDEPMETLFVDVV